MKSIQDQFLKAGLVDTKKAKKIAADKRKAKKSQAKGKPEPTSEVQQAIDEARQQKLQNDRELNLQQQAQAHEKAIAAKIIQLIKHYKVDRKSGDVEYNFKHDNVIKKMHVTAEVFNDVSRGRLCIVHSNNTYELIPKPIADKIAQHNAALIILDNKALQRTDEQGQSEDEQYYAQFEIPDDLTW